MGDPVDGDGLPVGGDPVGVGEPLVGVGEGLGVSDGLGDRDGLGEVGAGLDADTDGKGLVACWVAPESAAMGPERTR